MVYPDSHFCTKPATKLFTALTRLTPSHTLLHVHHTYSTSLDIDIELLNFRTPASNDIIGLTDMTTMHSQHPRPPTIDHLDVIHLAAVSKKPVRLSVLPFYIHPLTDFILRTAQAEGQGVRLARMRGQVRPQTRS